MEPVTPSPSSYSYTDEGLWIEGVSDLAGASIKRAVFEFRAAHQLADSAWHVKAYGESHNSIVFWIGMPPQPTFRHDWHKPDSANVGESLLGDLEYLLIAGKLPSDSQQHAHLS